jgi:hypothetical protein
MPGYLQIAAQEASLLCATRTTAHTLSGLGATFPGIHNCAELWHGLHPCTPQCLLIHLVPAKCTVVALALLAVLSPFVQLCISLLATAGVSVLQEFILPHLVQGFKEPGTAINECALCENGRHMDEECMYVDGNLFLWISLLTYLAQQIAMMLFGL